MMYTKADIMNYMRDKNDAIKKLAFEKNELKRELIINHFYDKYPDEHIFDDIATELIQNDDSEFGALLVESAMIILLYGGGFDE